MKKIIVMALLMEMTFPFRVMASDGKQQEIPEYVERAGDDLSKSHGEQETERSSLVPKKYTAARCCAWPRAGCFRLLSLVRGCLCGKEMDLGETLREAAEVQEEKEEIEMFLAGYRFMLELEREKERCDTGKRVYRDGSRWWIE